MTHIPVSPVLPTNRINSARQICPEITYDLPIWAPASPQYVEKNHRPHHVQTQIKHPIVETQKKAQEGDSRPLNKSLAGNPDNGPPWKQLAAC